jgi:hypothetical protein
MLTTLAGALGILVIGCLGWLVVLLIRRRVRDLGTGRPGFASWFFDSHANGMTMLLYLWPVAVLVLLVAWIASG